MEVKYGNATNVTVEIYLTYRWSRFKLQYGIVKQGLPSGELFYCHFKLIGKGDMENEVLLCKLTFFAYRIGQRRKNTF